MTRAALVFFILSIFVVLSGAYNLMGVSMQTIKILSVFFLVLGVLSYLGAMSSERKN